MVEDRDASRKTWLAVDPAGEVHARIQDTFHTTAERIACAAFPEVAGLRLVPVKTAPAELRIAAQSVPVLTERGCLASGLISPVEKWAGKLRGKFQSAGGAR